MPTILVSAGEASGDLYASLVVEELRRILPDTAFFGCTGPRLRAAGVQTVVDAASLAVVGLIEVVSHLRRRPQSQPRHPHRLPGFSPPRGPTTPPPGYPRGLPRRPTSLGLAQGPRP